MKLLSLTPRAFVRGYTAIAAIVCGIAVTSIVHDAPAANAEGAREAQAHAWTQQVARAERSVAAAVEQRALLRLTYNKLVRASTARYASHRR